MKPWIPPSDPPPPLTSPASFEHLAEELGALVASKNRAYGNAAANSGAILAILYPNGVAAHQYADALIMVRVLDKLSRIAQRGRDGADKGGESPWQDIAGYGLIGLRQDRGKQVR